MIWVDINEDAVCKIPKILKNMGIPIMMGSPPPEQPRFDYVINDNVAVERKEVADYFQSKQTGHLDMQLYDMSTNFSLSFLVIIGDIRSYMIRNRISAQVFYGSYIGSQIKVSPDGKHGTVIINNVPTDEDFALYLKILHDKFNEGNFTRLPVFVGTKASASDIALNVLCNFPNIGKNKADTILKNYGSLETALNIFLLKGKWEVKGIGDTINEKINKVMKNNYGSEKT